MRKVHSFLRKIGMIFLILFCVNGSFPVNAEEEVHRPLIQTTTFQEEYEGMVAFGGVRARILSKPDMEEAYRNVRTGVVQIDAGSVYGSGVIWEMNEKEIIVISNRHLLQDFNAASRVIFWGGTAAEGELLMLSDTYDLGFVKVDVADVAYDELTVLKEAGREDTAYRKLKSGDAVFVVGSADGVGSDWYEGTVGNTWWYIEDFDAYMLYCFCYGKPGMSGGGTYDAYGNFVGMLTGGTAGNETASIPVNIILEEYQSCCLKNQTIESVRKETG